MKTNLVLALAFLVLIAAVPLAGGANNSESPPPALTTLYMHPLNWLSMPMNTQVPQPSPSWPSWFPTTLTCAPALGNLAGLVNEYHSFWGYTSTGLVHYDIVENGMARITGNPGLVRDIQLEAEGTNLRWFVVVASPSDQLGTAPGIGAQGIAPNVVVRATIRTLEGILVDGSDYETGPILLQGQVGPATLGHGQAIGPNGQAVGNIQSSMVNGAFVYELTIPLQVQVQGAPGSQLLARFGFSVRVDMFVDNPACSNPPGGYTMPSLLSPYVDAKHWPSMELRHRVGLFVEEPITVTPQPDGLLFGWAINSVWGNYDVDMTQERITVVGPQGTTKLVRESFVQRIHEWHHTRDPVNSTWHWSFDGQGPPDGAYVAYASVPNLQGTAMVQSAVQFRMKDGHMVSGSEQTIPEVGVSALLFGILALVFAVRSRRRL